MPAFSLHATPLNQCLFFITVIHCSFFSFFYLLPNSSLLHCGSVEHVDLEDPQWEDIHVITGALKLFFRELPEPLVPYELFQDIVEAVSK